MLKALYYLLWDNPKAYNTVVNYTIQTSKYLLIGFTSVCTVTLVALFLLQRKLIYPSSFPQGSRHEVMLPSAYGLSRFENETLTTKDGVKIHIYLIKSNMLNCKNTLLFFHANAGNMGHRLPIVKCLFDQLHCNILMLSYRGYGKSLGSPSEHGIQADVDALFEFALSNEYTKDTSFFCYGQSIGGAVAIDTCYRYADSGRISGLIVENTFLSLPLVATHLFPALSPFKFVVRDKWDSKSKIASLQDSLPILFLSGKKDTLVPTSHMIKLAAIARAKRAENLLNEKSNEETSSSKAETLKPETSMPNTVHNVTFIQFHNGDHNTTCIQPGYFDSIFSWWSNFAYRRLNPLVLGIIIVDSQGLCLASWGSLKDQCSPTVISIIDHAEALLPNSISDDVIPYIKIETEAIKLVFKRHLDWSVAIALPKNAPVKVDFPDTSNNSNNEISFYSQDIHT
ncbi:hypothetical protein BB560_004026 [Smittium megazygosporum]|uniref:AB hydrolase-1 domain-containing protein n=1 Tax=Smittium megazygosporum TaxID=133381 RepID=A0A2T9ZAC5_9FUNG|nr:hypothetical protein BB560_004026 [Smittium megazygosporum]